MTADLEEGFRKVIRPAVMAVETSIKKRRCCRRSDWAPNDGAAEEKGGGKD